MENENDTLLERNEFRPVKALVEDDDFSICIVIGGILCEFLVESMKKLANLDFLTEECVKNWLRCLDPFQTQSGGARWGILVIQKWGGSELHFLHQKGVSEFTPQNSKMDTKNCHVFSGSYIFQGPSLWVSMLVLGRVSEK